MSAIKWNYKYSTRGISLVNADKFKGNRSNIKKGDSIPINVYEYFVQIRGGKPSTTTQYYMNYTPNKKAQLLSNFKPSGLKLKLNEDFVLEGTDPSEPKDFVLEGTDPSEPKDLTGMTGSIPMDGMSNKQLFNKKYLIYGLIAVAGYFAYKKFKK